MPFRPQLTANAYRGLMQHYAWALWLAAPVGVTVLAAFASWWSGHRARGSAKPPTTDEAMAIHTGYLQALTYRPRGTERVERRS